MEKKYYVYVHNRGDNGRPFYVGKGSGKRHSDTFSRNRWWKHISEKHGFKYKILRDGLSECCANTLERIVIHQLRVMGYNLCNITEGGDGFRHPNKKIRRQVVCSNGMEFDSVNAAGEWAGVSPSKITSVCRGRRYTSAGYTWWYKGEDEKEFIDPKSRMGSKRKVVRSDGVVFDSVMEAASSCGGLSSNIVCCAKGRIAKAYGFGWEYVK